MSQLVITVFSFFVALAPILGFNDHDPTPTIYTPEITYSVGEVAEVTISGMWPNNCVPEPNQSDFIDNPNPPEHLSIHLNPYTENPSVQVDLYELLNRREEYYEAQQQGLADVWYAENCSGGETEWSYTFASDDLDTGMYGTYILMNWKRENPLNDNPEWTCDPSRYCYIDEDAYTFHVGELVYLPLVRQHRQN